MLTVSNLSKNFGDLSIFANFNLELPARGFTVLIGPSGCGKSTLFNVLTGVAVGDGGTVSWRGEAVEYLKDTSAYMQQKDLLLPWLPRGLPGDPRGRPRGVLRAGPRRGHAGATARKPLWLQNRLPIFLVHPKTTGEVFIGLP